MEDENGFVWVYPELKPFTEYNREKHSYKTVTEYDNNLLYNTALDATRQLMFYFNGINGIYRTDPGVTHRPMYEIIGLIEMSDPNRMLYRDSRFDRNFGYDPSPIDGVPDQRGPANVTIFHLFLWDILHQDYTERKEDIFTTEETYAFLKAFFSRGIQWSKNLCQMVSAGEKSKRERITKTRGYIDRGLDIESQDWAYGDIAEATAYLAWLERQYEKLLPLFTQVGVICKRLSVETIMSNPIFTRYMYSSGGPIERAWHPQTGGSFLKLVQSLTFKDPPARGVKRKLEIR